MNESIPKSRQGGISVGPSHKQGGIPFTVAGKHVELEGDEITICESAYDDTKVYEFHGTPYQILMEIQKIHGCNTGKLTELHPNEYIICKKAVRDGEKIHVKGTVKQIIDKIQGDKGCVVSGGTAAKTINDDCGCKHDKKEDGGLTGVESLSYLLSDSGKIDAIGEEKPKALKNYIILYTSPFGSYRYVKFSDGKPVSALQIVSRDGKIGKVANVYTLPEYRNKGIAKELFKEASKKFNEISHSDIEKSQLGERFAKSTGIHKKMFGGTTTYFEPSFTDNEYTWKKSMLDVYRLYKTGGSITLGELINHPEFFKHYPKATRVKIDFKQLPADASADSFTHPGGAVKYNHLKITIKLNFEYYEEHGKEEYELNASPFPEYSKEAVLLHEMQHICQAGDGRPRGSGIDETSERTRRFTGIQGLYEEALVNAASKIAYIQQPAEQEAIHTVANWLTSIGLKYGNRENIIPLNSPTDAQDGLYEAGGPTLLAPNGNTSKLTPEQYKLVRTPAFKAWFGDWENDPQNSSKVVDENGEPLVVYRSQKDERILNIERASKLKGIYFSADKESTKIYGNITKEYFLNIHNPKLPEIWNMSVLENHIYQMLTREGYDGGIWIRNGVMYEIIAFHPNQIKLADGTNTTFDANNPDYFLEYEDGGPLSSVGSIQDSLHIRLAEIDNEIAQIWADIKASKEIQETLTGESYRTEYEARNKLYHAKKELNYQSTYIKNQLAAVQNGGELTTVVDKKGTEHNNVPDFTKVSTQFIMFNEDTLLVDPLPPYIPIINEDEFRLKGYVFDAIRINHDTYILASNGYRENEVHPASVKTYSFTGKGFEKDENIEPVEVPSDEKQGYVLCTLDQLVLISEYYYAKAKAILVKDAVESTRRQEDWYDKLPVDRRQKHFDQPYFYNSLPVAVKKKFTEDEWNKLDLVGKEAQYKPHKKYKSKKLKEKLESTHMWASFQDMYERFVDPTARPSVPIKGGGYRQLGLTEKRPSGVRLGAHANVWEYWEQLRNAMHWKSLDLAVQREFYSDARKIALETAFGETGTNDSLLAQWGILVKRQNGDAINPVEIDQILQAWVKINKVYGNLIQLARNNKLKISHAGNKFIFASKSVGVFIPDLHTIAASAKFGNEQFMSTLAHEMAHFIDYYLGIAQKHRWATDDYEGTAGYLATMFRSKMNKKTDNNYLNATKECFARAMQQYFMVEVFGQTVKIFDSENKYEHEKSIFEVDRFINQNAYTTTIKPLIDKFLAENKEFFSLDILPNNNEIDTAEAIESINDSDKTTTFNKNSVNSCEIQNENISLTPKIPPSQSMVNPEALQSFENERARIISLIDSNKNPREIKQHASILYGIVAGHPGLYPLFIDFILSLPKVLRVDVNPYNDDDEPNNITNWIAEQDKNLFELLPVKEYKIPKHKAFSTSPDDKTFMQIHEDFTGEYHGRKSLLGTHFDHQGSISTDAYRMLFVAHRNNVVPKQGNYCFTDKCFKNLEEVEAGSFVGYGQLIPSNSAIKLAVNEAGLYNYLKNMVNLGLLADKKPWVVLKITETKDVAVSAYDVLMALETMFALGHTQLEFGFSDYGDRPFLIYPAHQRDRIQVSGGKATITTDFVMLMVDNDIVTSSTSGGNFTSIINIENACATFVGNPKEYCFDLAEMEKKRNQEEKDKLVEKVEEAKNEVQKIREETKTARRKRIQGAWNKRVDKNTAAKLAADTAAAEQEVQELIEIL